MPHHGIFGTTESGKSTCAAILAHDFAQLIKRGRSGNVRGITVINPMLNRWNEANYQFATAVEGWNHLCKVHNQIVFVEETGLVIQNEPLAGRKFVIWGATVSRHLGHSFYFIAPRSIMLPKTARDMLSTYWLFLTSEDDAKTASKEFCSPGIAMANTLTTGEFFHVGRKHNLSRGYIDFKRRRFVMRNISSGIEFSSQLITTAADENQ